MKVALVLLSCAAAAPLTAQDGTAPTDTTRRFSFHYNIQPRFAFRFAFAFAPDSLREQRDRLALTRSQEKAIDEATDQAMEEFARLRGLLQIRQADLHRVLAAPKVDEAAATAALDAVLELENTIKRLRLTMLIRSKNTLDPRQQELRWQFGRSEP